MRTEVTQLAVGFICLLQSNDMKQPSLSNRRFFSTLPLTVEVAQYPPLHTSPPPSSIYLSLPVRPSVLLSRAIRRRSMHHFRHLLVRGSGGGDKWNEVGGCSLSLSVSHTLTPSPAHLRHQLLAMTTNCFSCTFFTNCPPTGSSPLQPQTLR